MSEITHDDIVSFVTEKVNLPPDMVKKHRKQVNALRERLEAKIDEDPAFDLIKMLHAGSVAKGTALRRKGYGTAYGQRPGCGGVRQSWQCAKS